jgi:phosphatidylserine decarboxylase
VVCRIAPGAQVRAGDRFGVMKFGSRMDVFVPPTATLAVTVGQKVRGGETIIAMLHSSA